MKQSNAALHVHPCHQYSSKVFMNEIVTDAPYHGVNDHQRRCPIPKSLCHRLCYCLLLAKHRDKYHSFPSHKHCSGLSWSHTRCWCWQRTWVHQYRPQLTARKRRHLSSHLRCRRFLSDQETRELANRYRMNQRSDCIGSDAKVVFANEHVS